MAPMVSWKASGICLESCAECSERKLWYSLRTFIPGKMFFAMNNRLFKIHFFFRNKFLCVNVLFFNPS